MRQEPAGYVKTASSWWPSHRKKLKEYFLRLQVQMKGQNSYDEESEKGWGSPRKVVWNAEEDMKNSSPSFEETLKQSVIDWYTVKVKKIKRI